MCHVNYYDISHIKHAERPPPSRPGVINKKLPSDPDFRDWRERPTQQPKQITIPSGWEAAAWAENLTHAGLCSYPELINGNIPMREFFKMARVLDVREYKNRISAENSTQE